MELLVQAAIGLIAGLVGGLLGIGGSIIIIPGLILYMSQTGRYEGSVQHLIQAAAMICNVFVAAPSLLAHHRARMIMKSVVAVLVPAALTGILFGVHLSNTSLFARQKGVYLAMVLAGFMVYVAGYNAWRLYSKTDLEDGFDERPKPSTAGVASVGVVMGLFAGLLGIGGGAICVPMQQALLRIPLRRAIANSAVTIVCVSTVGAIFKNATLPIDHGIRVTESLQLAAMLIPTAMIGSYVGGKLTHALPRTVLRVVFIAFMLAVAYLTFTEAWKATPLSSTSPADDGAIETPAPPTRRSPDGRSIVTGQAASRLPEDGRRLGWFPSSCAFQAWGDGGRTSPNALAAFGRRERKPPIPGAAANGLAARRQFGMLDPVRPKTAPFETAGTGRPSAR
jgi:hypothetical protein